MLKQCFWERFWTILKVSKFFHFWFFPSFDHPRCPGQFFLPKKIPRSMLKTCLNTFGNVFMHFEKKKVFPVFWSFSKFGPSRVHWASFFWESYLKTSSRLVWTLLRTFLDTFEVSKFFRFFEFLQVAISWLHWARKIQETTSSKLGRFG